MGSQTAAGSSLAISATLPSTHDAVGYAALTFIEVGQIEKLGTFGAAFAKVEYQPLKGAKQKYKGSAEYGALQPSIAIDSADAGQALMLVAADDESQKLYSFRVTLQDGAKRYFRGRVFGSPETADGGDSMLLATPTVEICTRVVRVDAGVTTVPSPTLSQPSISPTSGAVGTTLTAVDGTVTNGTLTGRRWLLGTTAIGTGTTVTPNAAGSLTLENTALGTNGVPITSTSNAVTIAAATPTPSPTIAFANTTASIPEGSSGTSTVSNTINVTRNGVTGPLTVNLTYGGTATSGTDYVAGPVSGTIADGQSSLSFDLTINGDTGVESDETIVINAVLAAYSSATASKTITITNDDVTVTPSPSNLRAISPTNWANGVMTGNPSTNLAWKWPHWIGSGDVSELRVLTTHFALGLTAIAIPTTSVTFGPMYLVDDVTGVAVQLTWLGATTVVINPGDTEVVTDPVLPGAFGLSVFTRDRRFYTNGVITNAAAGQAVCLQNINPPTDGSGAFAVRYNAASTTITNLNSKGAFTSTGTAPVNSNPPSTILLGKFVTGDPRTYAGIGDSIVENVGDRDTATRPSFIYSGFFPRSLWATANGAAGARGGINLGISGGKIDLWGDSTSYAKLKVFLKYCNAFIVEYGTNTWGTSSDVTAASQKTLDRALYAKIRTDAVVDGGSPIKIARTKLLPRTIGASNTAADGSDQSAYKSYWEAGGSVDAFNALGVTDAGAAGGSDAFLSFDAQTRLDPAGNPSTSTNYHRWLANTTADLIHPNGSTAEAMAAQTVRPWMASVE